MDSGKGDQSWAAGTRQWEDSINTLLILGTCGVLGAIDRLDPNRHQITSML